MRTYSLLLRKKLCCREILYKKISVKAMSQKVSVKMVPGEEKMKLSLKYCFPAGGKCISYNFDRLQNECGRKTLDRISANISKDCQNKCRKGAAIGKSAAVSVLVRLFDGDGPADVSLQNSELWKTGIKLLIEDQSYTVLINQPTIHTIELPMDSLMAGFPVYPKIRAEFSDLKQSKFKWLRTKAATSSDVQIKTMLDKVQKCTREEALQFSWEEIHIGFSYTPQVPDIGYILKVICVPCNAKGEEGDEQSAVSCEISAGPGLCPFKNRHMWTKDLVGSEG
jgi:2',5'-phosphodiesterase